MKSSQRPVNHHTSRHCLSAQFSPPMTQHLRDMVWRPSTISCICDLYCAWVSAWERERTCTRNLRTCCGSWELRSNMGAAMVPRRETSWCITKMRRIWIRTGQKRWGRGTGVKEGRLSVRYSKLKMKIHAQKRGAQIPGLRCPDSRTIPLDLDRSLSPPSRNKLESVKCQGRMDLPQRTAHILQTG